MADEADEPEVTEQQQVSGFIDQIHKQMLADDPEFTVEPRGFPETPEKKEAPAEGVEEVPEDTPVDDSPSIPWKERKEPEGQMGWPGEPRDIPIQNSAIADFVIQAEKEIETLRAVKSKGGQIERSMAIVQISERVLNARQNGGVEERVRKLEAAMTALWVTLRR